MRRVVVAADASFVSVGSESVAVIGPFGGYAAIDPATNAVTAAGQVASGATRVLRTSAAVWITNYADSQIVRIDPITSTVVGDVCVPRAPMASPSSATRSRWPRSTTGSSPRSIPAAESITRQVDVGGQADRHLRDAEDESVHVGRPVRHRRRSCGSTRRRSKSPIG